MASEIGQVVTKSLHVDAPSSQPGAALLPVILEAFLGGILIDFGRILDGRGQPRGGGGRSRRIKSESHSQRFGKNINNTKVNHQQFICFESFRNVFLNVVWGRISDHQTRLGTFFGETFFGISVCYRLFGGNSICSFHCVLCFSGSLNLRYFYKHQLSQSSNA